MGVMGLIFENISRLCRNRNISVAALEKALGFGNATIGRWKTSSPSIDKLKKVADFFSVSVDELIADSGEGGEPNVAC